jgi:DNA polymerase elongation subunit (family B)
MSGKPKILIFDIETAPIEGFVWSLWQQNVALNQIKNDWFVLSWAAKWLNEPEIFYRDQRGARPLDNDKRTLKAIWKLLDKADIVVTQNGKSFDAKKLNARFIIQGMKPPSSYRHIDTKLLAKKHFAFTSNRLEYMADKLNTKYKKLKHAKFPGFELWAQCLKRNVEAFKEMEEYNRHDVLALEELYLKLAPWDTSINFNVYHDREDMVCQCGHPAMMRYGYAFTNGGKYQRFKCKQCGAEYRSKKNLLSIEKRASLKPGVHR